MVWYEVIRCVIEDGMYLSTLPLVLLPTANWRYMSAGFSFNISPTTNYS